MAFDMKYDFDTHIDRSGTDSVKWHVAKNELPMWVADMDFKTAPEITAELRKRLDRDAFGYTIIPDRWYSSYIDWWKRRYDFEMKKEWLIFTTGVIPAISTLVRKLTTPAEKVLLQTPVYNMFFNSIVNNGRMPLESPLILEKDGYHMDFEQLEKDLSDPQTTLMILCNPQNPGGKLWHKDSLVRLAELCKKYGVTVISDEIHCDITALGKKYVPFASVSDTAHDISVTCLSPTKAFNIAGIHTAAVCVPNENLRHRVWRALNTDEIAEPDVLACEAAIAAYNEGEAWLDELCAYLWQNRQAAADFITEKIPLIHPIPSEATYLLWVDIRALKDHGRGFARFLRRKTGLFISNGASYGKTGEGFIRINLACPRDMVLDGMERLKKGVDLSEN